MSERNTPGPWRIANGAIDFGAIVADTPCRAMTDEQKAQELDPVNGYGGYIVAESIVKRNRPLIAFAPELRAACEDVHVILSACADIHDARTIDVLMYQAKLRVQYVLSELEALEAEVTK